MFLELLLRQILLSHLPIGKEDFAFIREELYAGRTVVADIGIYDQEAVMQ